MSHRCNDDVLMASSFTLLGKFDNHVIDDLFVVLTPVRSEIGKSGQSDRKRPRRTSGTAMDSREHSRCGERSAGAPGARERRNRPTAGSRTVRPDVEGRDVKDVPPLWSLRWPGRR